MGASSYSRMSPAQKKKMKQPIKKVVPKGKKHAK